MRLFNLRTMTLFSEYRTMTSSGKRLKQDDHVLAMSSKYRFQSSTGSQDDLSAGSDRDQRRRENNLSSYNTKKNKFFPDFFKKKIVARFGRH